MASCYREEGSLLVICPASMRLVWAEELERWLPYLSPLDVHLGIFLSPQIAQEFFSFWPLNMIILPDFIRKLTPVLLPD